MTCPRSRPEQSKQRRFAFPDCKMGVPTEGLQCRPTPFLPRPALACTERQQPHTGLTSPNLGPNSSILATIRTRKHRDPEGWLSSIVDCEPLEK
ncbi:unnamed protein product [Alternaria burnsii]|nr:unnamed protein product [Alternaria burnsii]